VKRSAEEFVRSRSCHVGMFSKDVMSSPRTTLARPQMFSLVMGLRLGHCGGPDLLFGVEELLDLAYFPPLQVADLCGELFQRGRDVSKMEGHLCIPVALEYLSGRDGNLQA
jgi:hypothetical protein